MAEQVALVGRLHDRGPDSDAESASRCGCGARWRVSRARVRCRAVRRCGPVVCSLLSTGRGSDVPQMARPYRKYHFLNKLCRRFKLCPKHRSVAHLHMCDAMCDKRVPGAVLMPTMDSCATQRWSVSAPSLATVLSMPSTSATWPAGPTQCRRQRTAKASSPQPPPSPSRALQNSAR